VRFMVDNQFAFLKEKISKTQRRKAMITAGFTLLLVGLMLLVYSATLPSQFAWHSGAGWGLATNMGCIVGMSSMVAGMVFYFKTEGFSWPENKLRLMAKSKEKVPKILIIPAILVLVIIVGALWPQPGYVRVTLESYSDGMKGNTVFRLDVSGYSAFTLDIGSHTINLPPKKYPISIVAYHAIVNDNNGTWGWNEDNIFYSTVFEMDFANHPQGYPNPVFVVWRENENVGYNVVWEA